MQQQYDPSIRLTQNGTPDVDYYIQQATVLRSRMIAESTLVFGKWLKKQLSRALAQLKQVQIKRTPSLQSLFGY